MLEAFVAGTSDPELLAELAKARLRAKLPALRKALDARFREHHGFLVAQVLAHVDYLEEAIAAVGERIDAAIAPFQAAVELLVAIPGVQRRTAEVVVAEIGVDMSCFATSRHLASWAGLSPGNNESAGKRKHGRTTATLRRFASECVSRRRGTAARARRRRSSLPPSCPRPRRPPAPPAWGTSLRCRYRALPAHDGPDHRSRAEPGVLRGA